MMIGTRCNPPSLLKLTKDLYEVLCRFEESSSIDSRFGDGDIDKVLWDGISSAYAIGSMHDCSHFPLHSLARFSVTI